MIFAYMIMTPKSADILARLDKGGAKFFKKLFFENFVYGKAGYQFARVVSMTRG